MLCNAVCAVGLYCTAAVTLQLADQRLCLYQPQEDTLGGCHVPLPIVSVYFTLS
jgi:hypothetical protein